jgi:hypothetical protein
MRKFLAPNIDWRGRLARAIYGAAMLAAAWFLRHYGAWVIGVLAGSGIFAFYEALRGWCVLRACGIKTKY